MSSTTKSLREPTLVEIEERTPAGQREMAAARLELRAVTLLSSALAASGRSQKDIAAELGVSEGRVSQVVGGDGNLRLSTIARYLRAMGYVPKLAAEPVSPGLPPIGEVRRHRQRAGRVSHEADLYMGIAQNGNTTYPIVTLMPQGVAAVGMTVLGQQLVGTVTGSALAAVTSSIKLSAPSAVTS